MQRDNRVVKKVTNKPQRRGHCSGPLQTLQRANSSYLGGDEALKRASHSQAKWNNHYLTTEGCFRSQYYCQNRPDEERREKKTILWLLSGFLAFYLCQTENEDLCYLA